MGRGKGHRVGVLTRLARAPVRPRTVGSRAAKRYAPAGKHDAPASSIDFANSTVLCGETLYRLCLRGIEGWSVGPIRVRVRYTRSTAFSGTCIYADRHIYVNLGRHLRYPYSMKTNLAKVQTLGRGWRREIFRIEMQNAYQLAIFIFMHELYHLLVYRAGRNTRQKESMCDRFAARYLVDGFGCRVRDRHDHPVPRTVWDFQDLEGFVAAARTDRRSNGQARQRRIPT